MKDEVGFLVALAAVLVIYLVRRWLSADDTTRRGIRAAPRVPIGRVEDGQTVRVVGSVEPLDFVVSPLTRRRCTFWHVRVEERRGSGRSAKWVQIVDEQAGRFFLVKDGSGVAVVETARVRPLLVVEQKEASGFLRSLSPEAARFLRERGVSVQDGILPKTMRMWEGVVERGEQVAAVGVGRWGLDAEGSRRLTLEAPPGDRLLLSDEPSLTR